MPSRAAARTVIGGGRYRSLRDHSLGIVMSDELEPHARPPALLIEDLCYGPAAVGQWLLDEALVAPITRAVFVTAIAREDGCAPGTISAYRSDRVLPSEELIQQAVVDAVTGVILLDNTLIVTEWMKALPAETIVVEVEPRPVSAIEQPEPADVADEASDHDTADVLAEAEQLVGALLAHPDPTVGEAATAPLDRIDPVHRAALTHLMGGVVSVRLHGPPAGHPALDGARRDVDDELYAVRNACGESPLPLDYSTLDGAELRCSWHGCRYDIRTGHRLDRLEAAAEELLRVLPVRVRDGLIEVVVGTSRASEPPTAAGYALAQP